jgi:NADP-dependent aldehyde dehydrogenase
MIQLTGKNFIGNERSALGKTIFKAINPVSESAIGPDYVEATSEEINRSVEKAGEAFEVYRKCTGKERAVFLENIANAIMVLGDQLIKRCCEETALPEARIMGERARTVNQLKLFASLLREGSWVDARIDTAIPDRQPLPKPDIRSMQMALGPVGIFGASNFPLAFSVAGGDTASALAAGCPVVVKAHPAHPGTCELVAHAIQEAVRESKMPDGTFSMVQGASHEVGMGIVNHPLIRAVGFTGSFRGGKALYDVAVQRPDPIPVYAEMGSVNPVFILPDAMKHKKVEIADGLATSVTLGVGQFCTNPGLVAMEKSEGEEELQQAIAENIRKINSGNMLTEAISQAYQKGIEKMKTQKGVSIIARGKEDKPGGIPYFFSVESDHFLTNDKLEEEVFGPSTLAINARRHEDLIAVARKMKGHLTATLYGTEKDLNEYRDLIDILQRKVGRLIINGFPTGVEVCHSMIHGGPFPATTDSRTTSVGTAAIYRFTRPVCFQNFPDHLLPDELKKNNPLEIWRIVNGERANN